MVTTSYNKAAELLLEGKIGLVPTDTIYGISSLISSEDAIERIYSIKGRDKDKPFITLIPDIDYLENFAISPRLVSKATDYWPGRNTLVFDLRDKDICEKYDYLHRGKKSLGFRVPDDEKLITLLKATGPIVSTSANISRDKTVNTAEKAQEIFGSKLDFYLDVGELKGKPSSVYKINSDSVVVLRK